MINFSHEVLRLPVTIDMCPRSYGVRSTFSALILRVCLLKCGLLLFVLHEVLRLICSSQSAALVAQNKHATTVVWYMQYVFSVGVYRAFHSARNRC